jgi:hypothetical protein
MSTVIQYESSIAMREGRPSASTNVPNGMPDCEAMSIFCGLPIDVAHEPAFALVASAMRYGLPSRPERRAISATSGVNIRQIVSFKKSAESTPETKTTIASRIRGERAIESTRPPAMRKKPDTRRFATIIIMARRRASVSVSTTARASCVVSPPRTTSRTAAVRAMLARFIARRGNLPDAIPTKARMMST